MRTPKVHQSTALPCPWSSLVKTTSGAMYSGVPHIDCSSGHHYSSALDLKYTPKSVYSYFFWACSRDNRAFGTECTCRWFCWFWGSRRSCSCLVLDFFDWRARAGTVWDISWIPVWWGYWECYILEARASKDLQNMPLSLAFLVIELLRLGWLQNWVLCSWRKTGRGYGTVGEAWMRWGWP